MANTLMTATEVVKYSPLSDHFDTGLICDHIARKENRFAREFLGKDFYQSMLAALVDYTGTEAYDSETTYSTDEAVFFNGTILTSLVDENTTAPCDDLDGSKWKVADKFSSECFNNLFTTYIRPYLAFLIAAEVTDYATYKIGAKGVTEFTEDESGIKSAGKTGFQSIKKKLYNDTEELLADLKDYLDDYDGECDYSEIEYLSGCSTNERKNYSRKIHFRY